MNKSMRFIGFILGIELVAFAALGVLFFGRTWQQTTCPIDMDTMAVRADIAAMLNRRGVLIAASEVVVEDWGAYPDGRFFRYSAGGHLGNGVGNGCGVIEFRP